MAPGATHHITKNKNKKPNWQDGAICSKIANGPRLPPRGSLPLTDGRLWTLLKSDCVLPQRSGAVRCLVVEQDAARRASAPPWFMVTCSPLSLWLLGGYWAQGAPGKWGSSWGVAPWSTTGAPHSSPRSSCWSSGSWSAPAGWWW